MDIQGLQDEFTRVVVDQAKDIKCWLEMAGVDKQDVDDVYQDVVLKAWEQLATIKNTASLKSWILSVARNLVIDGQRRVVPPVTLGFEDTLPEGNMLQQSPEEYLIEREEEHLQRRAVAEALQDAPPQTRTIVERYLEGESQAEIAAALNVARPTIHILFKRFCERVRDRYAVLAGQPSGRIRAEKLVARHAA